MCQNMGFQRQGVNSNGHTYMRVISSVTMTLFTFLSVLCIMQTGVHLQLVQKETQKCSVVQVKQFVGYRLNISALESSCRREKVYCFMRCLEYVECSSFAVVRNDTCDSLCLLYPHSSINKDFFLEDNTSVYHFMESPSCCKSPCLNGGMCDSKICKCQCPKGFFISKCTCQSSDYSWKKVPGTMKQIDSREQTWAVKDDKSIWILEKDSWTQTDGLLVHVSSGEAGVWGVNHYDNIFFRNGVTETNPKGTSWTYIAGGLKQIDSGISGVVYGVNRNNYIYCRSGISEGLPYGNAWKMLSGRFKYVSCGDYGCWAIKPDNSISFRTGVTSDSCAGAEWIDVDGSLVQLEAGFAGVVHGISSDGNLYTREGVCEGNPTGYKWKHIKGTTFAHVTGGMSTIYAIAKNGSILASPA